MDLCNENDRELIRQIPMPGRSKPDSWYWILEHHGEFTIKSGYRRIQGERREDELGFWKQLWALKLPDKVVNFLWRACKNVLPTVVELRENEFFCH